MSRPRSSVADFDIAIPAGGSGSDIVSLAAAPVHIDREANTGVYHDPNVWVVHADGSPMVRRAMASARYSRGGEVPEWSIGPVLKTGG